MVKISMYTSGGLAWENSGDGYQIYNNMKPALFCMSLIDVHF